MKKPLFPEGATATFADYFQLNAETEEVLAELGFSFRLKSCELPRKQVDQKILAELKQRLERVLPHVSLGNLDDGNLAALKAARFQGRGSSRRRTNRGVGA